MDSLLVQSQLSSEDVAEALQHIRMIENGSLEVPPSTLLRTEKIGKNMSKPSITISLGIMTRGGKVSGSEVLSIPSQFSPIVNWCEEYARGSDSEEYAINSILIESYPPGSWFIPRSEPAQVAGPVVYFNLSSVEAQLYVGDDESAFKPKGRGAFEGMSHHITLCKQGEAVVLPNNDDGTASKIALGTVNPSFSDDDDGDDDTPLLLMSCRFVRDVPKSVLQRETDRLRKQLTVVKSVDVEELSQHLASQHLTEDEKGVTKVAKVSSEILEPVVQKDSNQPQDSCDTTMAPPNSIAQEPEIERRFVANVYDTIAVHWDRTRHKPWPKVVEFLQSLDSGSLVADVGCGNGKYLGVRKDIVMLGSDRSVNLCDVSRSHGYEVALCDGLFLPYRQGVFDGAISIAVLHHFSTHARRLRAVQQMASLLRVGGKLLVQAWALEQESDSKRSFPSQDVLVPWQHLQADSEIQEDDAIAPVDHADSIGQTGNNNVYQRYCHVYREGELGELVEEAGMVVEESYFDRSNWCVIAIKQQQYVESSQKDAACSKTTSIVSTTKPTTSPSSPTHTAVSCHQNLSTIGEYCIHKILACMDSIQDISHFSQLQRCLYSAVRNLPFRCQSSREQALLYDCSTFSNIVVWNAKWDMSSMYYWGKIGLIWHASEDDLPRFCKAIDKLDSAALKYFRVHTNGVKLLYGSSPSTQDECRVSAFDAVSRVLAKCFSLYVTNPNMKDHHFVNTKPMLERTSSLFAGLSQFELFGFTSSFYVPDVSVFQHMQTLALSRCHDITDLSPLSNVHTLELNCCHGITDVSPLRSVHTLTLNSLRKVSSVSCLGCVHDLTLLFMHVSDVSQLGGVHTLLIFPSISILDVSTLGNVFELSLDECYPTGMDKLEHVTNLDLTKAGQAEDVQRYTSAKSIALREYSDIDDVSMFTCASTMDLSLLPSLKMISGLSWLVTLIVMDCCKITRIGDLPSLLRLDILNCEHLVVIDNVPSLEELQVDGCSELVLSSSVSVHLKELMVNNGHRIIDSGRFPLLRFLDISRCGKDIPVQSIHNLLSKLKRLTICRDCHQNQIVINEKTKMKIHYRPCGAHRSASDFS
eukprot:m.198141 g.198141  ORF g.198141 m.198141 type:complete len:1092 (-) comp13685_c1_seq1:1986-5261(-)